MPGSRDGLQHTTGASGALGLFKNCSTGVVTQPCKHPKCAIILKRTCRSYLNKAGFFQKFSKIEIAPVVNFLFLTLAARPRSLVVCREAEGFVTAGSLRAVAAPGVETTSFCCDLRATRGTCPETSSTFCPSLAPATPQPRPSHSPATPQPGRLSGSLRPRPGHLAVGPRPGATLCAHPQAQPPGSKPALAGVSRCFSAPRWAVTTAFPTSSESWPWVRGPPKRLPKGLPAFLGYSPLPQGNVSIPFGVNNSFS